MQVLLVVSSNNDGQHPNRHPDFPPLCIPELPYSEAFYESLEGELLGFFETCWDRKNTFVFPIYFI